MTKIEDVVNVATSYIQENTDVKEGGPVMILLVSMEGNDQSIMSGVGADLVKMLGSIMTQNKDLRILTEFSLMMVDEFEKLHTCEEKPEN